MSHRTAVVVPTLGASPHLEACLTALGLQGEDVLRVVVWQGGDEAEAERRAGAAEQLVLVPRPLGFAAAVNLGLAAAGGLSHPAAEERRVAVVNDDAVVAPGWLQALHAALDGVPRAAAAQGVVLTLEAGETTDGMGLAWNRWLQAVQLGRGEPPPPLDAPPREVFGVSATAALYRADALAAVARPVATAPGAPPEVFDTRLGSYYEDVDLAVRLHAAGWSALAVPAARARHAGSATGRRRRGAMRRQVYGNRYLVAASLLGRELPRHLPRMLLRDVLDLGSALLRAAPLEAASVAAGWCRAARRLGAFAHRGAPTVPPAELAAGRWREPGRSGGRAR